MPCSEEVDSSTMDMYLFSIEPLSTDRSPRGYRPKMARSRDFGMHGTKNVEKEWIERKISLL